MSIKPVQLVAGDTWTRSWALADDAGQPLDLTGCTVRLHVRDTAQNLVIEADTTNGQLVVTPLIGLITMTVPAVNTGITAGGYRYAIEVTFSDGTVRTIERNTLVILDDLTYD